MGTVAIIKLFIILCIPIIINAGPGLACNGTNFSDLIKCCTEQHQCGLYQGDCATDSQCKGNLKCGIKNCKLTSNETSYAENWQEFNCCYNGMSIGKKTIVDLSLTILLFFCLEQRSLSCHVPNLDELTVKECEQADSPCMIKKIGKAILSLLIRVLYMEWIKLN